VLQEGGRAIGTCKTRVNNFFVFFLICIKSKRPLGLNNNNIRNHNEITIKPLESWLKNLNDKDNVILLLFYQIWKYKNAFIVITQFWILQIFFKCYFIFIIIHKKSKEKRKELKIQKYIFLGSTVIFHKKRAHRINTSQTMSIEIKIEFQAVWGQTCYFRSKLSPSGQYEANHVD